MVADSRSLYSWFVTAHYVVGCLPPMKADDQSSSLHPNPLRHRRVQLPSLPSSPVCTCCSRSRRQDPNKRLLPWLLSIWHFPNCFLATGSRRCIHRTAHGHREEPNKSSPGSTLSSSCALSQETAPPNPSETGNRRTQSVVPTSGHQFPNMKNGLSCLTLEACFLANDGASYEKQ